MAVFTIDFHTHLLEKGVLPEVYWRAAKEKGLDAVAITEHADKKPGKAYQLLSEKKPKGMLLLPGMELNTSIGHVLALAKNEEIYMISRLQRKGLPIKKAIKLAESENLLLLVAHPWGLSYDSAAYILGEARLNRLVESERIGVEAYNGIFGNVGSFFYATNWVRKPMNFFDFLEKSRLGKKTRLSKLGKRGREKLDKKGKELLERCAKPFELAEKASFVAAGSDAHKPANIGTGITKLAVEKKSPEGVLESLQDKGNVKWLGPFVKETGDGYVAEVKSVRKAEVLSGLKYVAKRALMKKASGKAK